MANYVGPIPSWNLKHHRNKWLVGSWGLSTNVIW
jgi:hypothetical protein